MSLKVAVALLIVALVFALRRSRQPDKRPGNVTNVKTETKNEDP